MNDRRDVNLTEAPAEEETVRPVVEGDVTSAHTGGPWFQYRSSRGFEWNRHELPIEGLHHSLDGLRIVHLTDFHMRKWRDPAYDDLLEAVRKNAPDLIIFTGDFVDNKRDFRPAMPNVLEVMRNLRGRLGTYAILGNHDNDLLGPPVAGVNVKMIDHRRVCLHSGEATIELIGLPGVARDDFDPAFVRSIPAKSPDAVRIVLSHFPDLVRRSTSLQPDLFLCGHTHGGQICPPGGYPITCHDSLPRKYCTGVHRVYDTWLVTNRGFGFSSALMLRLFCPAEVIEIKLIAA